MVSVVSYLVVIALVLVFAISCALFGYFEGFFTRDEFKKSDWWVSAYEKALNVLFCMQAVCSILAVTLMVLTTKRLQNLVFEFKID